MVSVMPFFFAIGLWSSFVFTAKADSFRGAQSVSELPVDRNTSIGASLDSRTMSQPGECVPVGGSCNPLKNICCQGPTLMSCRLRAFSSGIHGMAFMCGPEFPNAKPQIPTLHPCIVEGSSCDPVADSCCQVDAFK